MQTVKNAVIASETIEQTIIFRRRVQRGIRQTCQRIRRAWQYLLP